MSPADNMAQLRVSSSSHRSNTNNGNTSQESDDHPAPVACEQCRNRKVRCDRQIPQCSSCEKAGVLCEFPSRGRRVNPVKQLVEDVSGLTTRLDSLDGSIQSLLRQMSTRPLLYSYPSYPPSRSDNSSIADHAFNDLDDMDLIFSKALDGQDSWNRHGLIEHLGSDQETPKTLPITTSSIPIGNLACLKKGRETLKNLLEKMAASSPPLESSASDSNMSMTSLSQGKIDSAIQSELRHKYDTFPDFNEEETVTFPPSGQSVALPPQSILEASLQLFLDEFNAVTPIFNESRLREAIQANYGSGASKTDEAYNLCFNNIVVLASGLRARLARLDKSYPKGMNEELLPAFLNNSFRAFHHLKFFLPTRHVNLQALATLALVAREYHESRVFNMICHLACDLFKSMNSDPSNGSEADEAFEDEKRDLYWTLFVMDKQRTCVAGQPFDLHFYDSDLPVDPEGATLTPAQQNRIMHIYMTTIWEETYISLYSARASRKGYLYRESQIARLDQLAHKWCARNRHLFSDSPADDLSVEEKWRVELKYAFHVGQVLIHSCSDSANSKQVELKNSKAAMQIINRVLKSNPTEGSLTLLCRLLRNYPLVAVHTICIRFLENPSIHMFEDLELLAGVRDALGILVDPNVPTCGIEKTYTGVSWYLDVIQTLRKILESPSSPAERQLGSPGKRAQDAVPLSSQPGQSESESRPLEPPSKRMKIPATGPSSQINGSVVSDSTVEKDLDLPMRKHNRKRSGPSEEPQSNHLSMTEHTFRPSTLSPMTSTLPAEILGINEMSQFLHDVMPSLSPPSVTSMQNYQPPLAPQALASIQHMTQPSSIVPLTNLSSFLETSLDPSTNTSDTEDNNFDSFLACSDFPPLGDSEMVGHYMSDELYTSLLGV